MRWVLYTVPLREIVLNTCILHSETESGSAINIKGEITCRAQPSVFLIKKDSVRGLDFLRAHSFDFGYVWCFRKLKASSARWCIWIRENWVDAKYVFLAWAYQCRLSWCKNHGFLVLGEYPSATRWVRPMILPEINVTPSTRVSDHTPRYQKSKYRQLSGGLGWFRPIILPRTPCGMHRDLTQTSHVLVWTALISGLLIFSSSKLSNWDK